MKEAGKIKSKGRKPTKNANSNKYIQKNLTFFIVF
jgi:hypothetical protein